MSKTSGPLRWGMISAGQISHDFALAFTTLPPTEHKLVAVAARKVEAAQEFAKKHGIPKVLKSYEDVAKDPEVDVVYIGSIHPEHLRLSKMVLDHGKHLLCEKPLCMNVRETKELVEYARKKKLFLMEAIWSRFFPAYVRLREEIAKGTIGEVIQVRAEMGLIFPEDNWRLAIDCGGGSVLDIGTYPIQFMSMCFGGQKPSKVVASGHLNSSGSDDSSSSTVIYPNGKTGTLVTHIKVDLPNEALVVGTKGSMKLHAPFWSSNKLETPAGIEEFPFPQVSPDAKFFFRNSVGLAYQCHEVRCCIQNGLTESPIMSLDETIIIAEMRESIRKQIGVVYPQDSA